MKGETKASVGYGPIEVLEENWNTARVFELCSWEVVWPMSEKPVYWRIPMVDILAICKMLDIPQMEWGRIAEGIKTIMQPVVKVYFNSGKVVI